LRLAAALHYAALSARDPLLSALYPPKSWTMETLWPVARAFLDREAAWVAAFLTRPPQTNEPRRAIVLLTGFLRLAQHYALPPQLFELGASAGLIQAWDRFAYRTSSWRWNWSVLELCADWRGPAPPVAAPVEVVGRQACDLNPLDLRDPDQRLRLRSYIWADQSERLARFDAAADIAVAAGVQVARQDAAEWLSGQLPQRKPGALAIVYHSIFIQYLPPERRAALAEAMAQAGGAATAESPLAWLRFEPEAALHGPPGSHRYLLDLVTWPGGEHRVLAAADPHARWVEAYA